MKHYAGQVNSPYLYDIINKSGETMPAFSIMQLATTGNVVVNKRLFTGVVQPSDGVADYLVSGPYDIDDDGYGSAGVPIYPLWAKYSGTAPAQGDVVGPSDGDWTVSTDGSGFVVWHVDTTNSLVFIKHGPCPYYWEFEVSGGDPSSGTFIWSITLNGDTQDVTLTDDMTAAELKTELLSEFSGLATGDLDVTGGPFPEKPLTVEWKNAFAGYASDDWDNATAGTNTYNNDAGMRLRQLNPR